MRNIVQWKSAILLSQWLLSIYYFDLEDQRKIISVIKEMPERKFLISGDCNSVSDGSMTRNDREVLLLGEKEDISQWEVFNSEGKTGNWIIPDVTWRPPPLQEK